MDDLNFIPLKASLINRNLGVFFTLLASLSVCLSAFVWFYKVLIILLLLAWLIQQWPSLNATVIKGLRCAQGQWFLQREDKEFAVELCGEQLALPWLMALNFKESSNNKKHQLALWPDSADKDELRKLRVFLKFSNY